MLGDGVDAQAGTLDRAIVAAACCRVQWFIPAATGRLSPARGALFLPGHSIPIAHARGRVYKSGIPMAPGTALADVIEQRSGRASEPDPLGFLAGRRYTCYCGREVVGSMLCLACAEEMARHFLPVAKQSDKEG
jgi:hypothetical protein